MTAMAHLGRANMNVRPEVGKWLTDHHVVWLDGDELLCRVPFSGIDWTMLEEMVWHQAEVGAPVCVPQRAQSVGPALAPWHLVPQPVHRRFEVYAATNPGARAVKFGRSELTYGELDSQADGLAALLQEEGLGPGDLCAVCMPASLALVRAILAVLKAGGVCVPLDPALQAGQIAAVFAAVHPRMGITQEGFSDRFATADARLIFSGEEAQDWLDSWPHDCPTDGGAAACVTCGFSETGDPILVVKDHMNVIDRLESMQEISPIGQGDSLLQSADYAFDATVWEFLWPLTHGARLVILPPRERMNLDRMRQLIVQERITVMHVNLR
jgi:non-ribosomal peptide synthetase component F